MVLQLNDNCDFTNNQSVNKHLDRNESSQRSKFVMLQKSQIVILHEGKTVILQSRFNLDFTTRNVCVITKCRY